MIDDALFIVILLGIGLAILYMYGALKARRVRELSADVDGDQR